MENQESWVYTVLESADYKCGNCGSDDGITIKLIVPEEAGGKKIPSNCAVLCKGCRFQSERSFKGEMVPTSFWLSRPLHTRLVAYCERENSTVSSVIRGLMSHFVSSDYTSFEPIWAYQEEERDVKVNVQIDQRIYSSFRAILSQDRRTVQEAMVALLHNFLEKTESSVNV